MLETLLLCLIAFLGGLVQGLTGFGVILVGLPLMALLIDIKIAIPLNLLLALAVNGILLIQLAGHAEVKKWLPLFLFSLPGIPLGVHFLKSIEPRWLELLVGAVVLAMAAVTRLRRRPGKELSKAWAVAAGLCAGFLGGGIGAAGPPVIIYVLVQPWEKHAVKSTLVVFFTLVGIGAAGLQFYSGLMTRAVMADFGWCVLPLVCGVLAGIALFNRIDEAGYKRAVHFLLVVLGVMMVIKGAMG